MDDDGQTPNTQATTFTYADGSAIPGLYATGTSTASVMGPVEAGGGGSIGPTFTWAYVAAAHAASAVGAAPVKAAVTA